MAEAGSKRKKFLRGPYIYFLIAPLVVLLGWSFLMGSNNPEVKTERGLEILKAQELQSVKIVDGEQRVDLELVAEDSKTGTKNLHFFYVHQRGDAVIDAVNNAKIKGDYTDEVPKESAFFSLLSLLLPIIIFGLLFWFFISAMGNGNKMMQIGKSRAKLASKETPQVRFSDVAGAEEAVEELYEIKDFLEDSERFLAVGAKIPKGVLLYGPPGTGKTLLARAVAGEAGVPFYAISGSDFVEMFVGVGASRVRDLFKEAKANAPAIIFIDEIDAVGQRRGHGMGGGHDEREQTLNQMLVEMDGFEGDANVIMIAATNRPDMLDPALLRPGRFDRQIGVDAPSMKGRRDILEVHSKGKPLSKNVDLDSVARKTPGFTGADLANVLNEAALLTARSRAQLIDNRALDEAIDRVMAGPQRRTRMMKDHERLVTAYHEGGHALVAAGMNHTDPVTKITILPRGRALGYTMVIPLDDKYSVSRNELQDQIAYALGGRVAEELVFHDPTTGAGNDIDKATDTARKMVTDYGMSAKLGPVKLGNADSSAYMGDSTAGGNYSGQTAQLIDAEVREIMERAHNEAYEVLTTNRHILDRLALELLEKETLDHNEIAEIFKDVKKIAPRETWLSSTQRPVSDVPPIKVPDSVSADAQHSADTKPVGDAADLPHADGQFGAGPGTGQGLNVGPKPGSGEPPLAPPSSGEQNGI